MVDRGEALQSRPGRPDRGELPMQPQRRFALRRPIDGCAHCFRLRRRGRDATACASAAEKSSGAMDDDGEPHPGVTEAAEFVALSFVAARLIGLNAQAVHMPGHRVDLAGEARNPEGVDDVLAGDHDVDRRARGQVQDVPRLHPAMLGIAERPAPLPALGFDPRPARVPAAAAAARRRSAHRRRAAAARRPAGRGHRARSSARPIRSSPSRAARSPARRGR